MSYRVSADADGVVLVGQVLYGRRSRELVVEGGDRGRRFSEPLQAVVWSCKNSKVI